VVYEGVLPFDPVVKTLSSLSERRMPTRFEIFSEFHRDVESAFIEREAQFMISVIPPQKAALESIKLMPLRMFLVAEAKHPLVTGRKARTVEDLKLYPFLTVKGSDPRLNLSTGIIDELSSFHMCDFNSKKFAILSGIGFGWMPECLIERELRLKKLKLVRWQKANTHTLQPYLYHRGERHMGKAARAFLHEFMNYQSKPLCERCIENPRRENCCG
jgi:DNA-binding transcriptional LysR family regulator